MSRSCCATSACRGCPGIEFLKSVRERWPETVRMIISGYTDAHDIIDGINEAGIYQYITKPWHPNALSLILRNAVQLFRMQRENELLAVEMRHAPSTAGHDGQRAQAGAAQGL